MNNNIPKFKCRASCAGKIMTEPVGKSNLDKYTEAIENLSKKQQQLVDFKDQECKTAKDIRSRQIPNLKNLISELLPVKDVKELSETHKQYLKEWILEKKYGRRKEFTTKYTEKGLKTEQEGFQLIQDVMFPDGKTFLKKCQKEYEDEYFTAHLDLNLPEFPIDNKSSWGLFTFPIGETEPPDKSNKPQILIYIRVTKKSKGYVIYTLNNTPIEIVESEVRKYAYANGYKDYEDVPEEELYEICKNHAFTKDFMRQLSFIYGTHPMDDFIEIPKEKRMVKFEYQRDVDFENRLIEKVLLSREWINANWNKF
jgi:hypothetical protein